MSRLALIKDNQLVIKGKVFSSFCDESAYLVAGRISAHTPNSAIHCSLNGLCKLFKSLISVGVQFQIVYLF